jgi:hypothetical protein
MAKKNVSSFKKPKISIDLPDGICRLHSKPKKKIIGRLNQPIRTENFKKTVCLVPLNVKRSQKFEWRIPDGTCPRGLENKKTENLNLKKDERKNFMRISNFADKRQARRFFYR